MTESRDLPSAANKLVRSRMTSNNVPPGHHHTNHQSPQLLPSTPCFPPRLLFLTLFACMRGEVRVTPCLFLPPSPLAKKERLSAINSFLGLRPVLRPNPLQTCSLRPNPLVVPFHLGNCPQLLGSPFLQHHPTYRQPCLNWEVRVPGSSCFHLLAVYCTYRGLHSCARLPELSRTRHNLLNNLSTEPPRLNHQTTRPS